MITKLSSFLHCPLFSLGYFVKEIENIFFVFLSSYRNKSGGLGEREMLWEHKPQASVSTAFSSKHGKRFLFLK